MIIRGEGICYEEMFSRVGLVVTTHSLVVVIGLVDSMVNV